jgi:hypothetical protein
MFCPSLMCIYYKVVTDRVAIGCMIVGFCTECGQSLPKMKKHNNLPYSLSVRGFFLCSCLPVMLLREEHIASF